MYGLECWSVDNKTEYGVSVAEIRMLKWMCGMTRKDIIRN